MTREQPQPTRMQGAVVAASQGAALVEAHRPTMLLWAGNAQNYLLVASPLEVLYISSPAEQEINPPSHLPKPYKAPLDWIHVVAGDSNSPVPAGFLTSAEAKTISRCENVKNHRGTATTTSRDVGVTSAAATRTR